MRNVLSKMKVYHAGLYDCDAVLDVNLEDSSHAGKRKNQAAVLCDRSATESCPSSARDDGNLMSGSDLDAAGYFVGGIGEGDYGREGAVNRAIVFKDDQVFGLMKDIVSSDDGLKFLNYGFEVHRRDPSFEANHS